MYNTLTRRHPYDDIERYEMRGNVMVPIRAEKCVMCGKSEEHYLHLEFKQANVSGFDC